MYNGVVKPNSRDTENISYLNGELEAYKEAKWLQSTSTVKEHVDGIVQKLLSMSNKNYVESLCTTTNAYKNNSGVQIIPDKNSDTSIKVITYTQKQ